MKKYLPWIFTGIFALEAFMALLPRHEKTFQTREFAVLPTLLNGRIQPLGSVARNTLLQIRSAQSVPLEGNGGSEWGTWEQLRKDNRLPLTERHWWQFAKHPKRLKATDWLMEAMMRPDLADDRYIFLVHLPELLNELKLEGKGIENEGLRYFSFNELRPALDVVDTQVQRVLKSEAENRSTVEQRTVYQKQLFKLANALRLYSGVRFSLRPERSDDFAQEIDQFLKSAPAGVTAVKRQQAGQEFNQQDLDRIIENVGQYDRMATAALLPLVPPARPEESRDNWTNIGNELKESVHTGEVPPAVKYYAAMVTAYRHDKPDDFNRAVADYRQWLGGKFAPELSKGVRESFFNNFQPFYRAMLIYLFAFLLGCGFWFNWSEPLRRSAFCLIVLAGLIHTFGLVFRMVLEGRPPVTNLYSSAIFIGWGAVILGLVLESIYKDGIGVVTAAAIGFVTQIIAHNLALGGDTMEMLQAVLDTNFWLATHVVAVTTGYASTFVAGFLGLLYILRGVFTRSLSDSTSKALARMMYGIVCFATLFSFVGTVLGGIWADQSWGRFWGWDPKENGALIIVLWNATILHARWGGMIRERGLACMAVFGNIVTSYSWFGVNMLGIGLHSYGFMDQAFKWLIAFVISQVVLIAIGLLPPRYWLSFRDSLAARASAPPAPEPPGKARPASAGA